MQINKSGRSGFTLVEMMIVVAVIGLLAAIAIPNFIKARQTSQKSACISNLKQIQTAIIAWALENKKMATDTVDTTALYGPTNYIKVPPLCPGGGDYIITTVGVEPACSLSAQGHTL